MIVQFLICLLVELNSCRNRYDLCSKLACLLSNISATQIHPLRMLKATKMTEVGKENLWWIFWFCASIRRAFASEYELTEHINLSLVTDFIETICTLKIKTFSCSKSTNSTQDRGPSLCYWSRGFVISHFFSWRIITFYYKHIIDTDK